LRLERWAALTRFLDDGLRLPEQQPAERALRGIAIVRRNWTFAGFGSGGRRAAAIYSVIKSARFNDVHSRTSRAEALARGGPTGAALRPDRHRHLAKEQLGSGWLTLNVIGGSG
jgi:hypothetical protein